MSEGKRMQCTQRDDDSMDDRGTHERSGNLRSGRARGINAHAVNARGGNTRGEGARRRAGLSAFRRAGVMALAAFVATLGVLLWAPPAHAQAQDAQRTAEARALYDAGAVAFGDGRFEDALGRWQEAYELSSLPALLYNIGTAQDRLGQPAAALESYEAYLVAVPEAENGNYVRRRIEVLQEQVARLAVTPDNTDPVVTDPVVTDPVVTDPIEDPIETVEPVAPTQGGVNVPALILTATGGAMVVAGVVTGLMANSRYSDLEDSCVNGVCTAEQQGDIDSLGRLALVTDILLVVGGVATVAGVVWMLVGGGSDDDEQAVRLDVGPRGVSLSGRF